MLLFSLLNFSCTQEESTTKVRKSSRGETCSFTNDCNSTLACVNQICVQDEYPVAVEAKSCILVECQNNDDCCSTQIIDNGECGYWTELCEEERSTCSRRLEACSSSKSDCLLNSGEDCLNALEGCLRGNSEDCNYISYECNYTCQDAFVVCESANNCSSSEACEYADLSCECSKECVDNLCLTKRLECDEANDCSGAQICVSGKCVECVGDDGCGDREICDEGVCIPGCTTDSECPIFSDCVDAHCEERGCVSNRECILFTGNGASICLNEQCIEPCQANSQCGHLKSCVNNQCTFLGCETDRDCRALAGNSQSSFPRGELMCVDNDEVPQNGFVIHD